MENTMTPPASTQAFGEVVTQGFDILHTLIAVEALRGALFDAQEASGTSRYELPMGQFERAVGAGTELPPLIAAMADFEQEQDGRWYSGEGGDAGLLAVPEDLLAAYLRDLATHI